VALLRATAGAYDLKRLPRVADVADTAQMILIERGSEARPAGAALELRAGLEQGQPAKAAGEHALALLGEEDATKRRLVTVMKHDAALFTAEAIDQFSELCLAKRRQVKLGRRGGVRHREPVSASEFIAFSPTCRSPVQLSKAVAGARPARALHPSFSSPQRLE